MDIQTAQDPTTGRRHVVAVDGVSLQPSEPRMILSHTTLELSAFCAGFNDRLGLLSAAYGWLFGIPRPPGRYWLEAGCNFFAGSDVSPLITVELSTRDNSDDTFSRDWFTRCLGPWIMKLPELSSVYLRLKADLSAA